jgi:hypothetical protein
MTKPPPSQTASQTSSPGEARPDDQDTDPAAAAGGPGTAVPVSQGEDASPFSDPPPAAEPDEADGDGDDRYVDL